MVHKFIEGTLIRKGKIRWYEFKRTGGRKRKKIEIEIEIER